MNKADLYIKVPHSPKEWEGFLIKTFERISSIEDLLRCLADVAANNQPNMSYRLYGALIAASDSVENLNSDIDGLRWAVSRPHEDTR